ncbi:unnamed protein product [Lampetra planeri]
MAPAEGAPPSVERDSPRAPCATRRRPPGSASVSVRGDQAARRELPRGTSRWPAVGAREGCNGRTQLREVLAKLQTVHHGADGYGSA